jgi:hypothetical protein
MRCKLVFSLLFLVLSLGFISASFSLGTPAYDIQEDYEFGDKIQGWINISFTEENYSSLFEDSFGNEASLEELLDGNSGYVYNDSLPNVTSEMQILYLDGFFDVPESEEELEYELNFTGERLFKQNITIEIAENTTLKILAAKAIKDKEKEIEDFKILSQSYTGFIKEKINTTFNVLNLDKKIAELQENYTNADSDAEYQYILNEASLLKIPKVILETNSIEDLNFYPKKESINLNILAGITGEEYSEENRNNYLDKIFIWSQDAVEILVDFKEISASYGETQEVLFRYFNVRFVKKPPMSSYLIIENMQNLEFGGNYNQQAYGNYYYISLEDIYGGVVFTTSEDVNFINLPMFVSPALSDLPDIGTGDDIIDGKSQMRISKWIFFGLIILFLLVIAMVVYSIVSTWYDKKYEDYLFPNKNNLYNLIIFINNSKKKGVEDEEIEKSLRKSKWSNEQIKYVMRKYAGKRTGMIKLPFKKIRKIPSHAHQNPAHRVHPGPIRGPSGQLPGSSSRPR